jgi:hypothetical protein
LEFVQALTVVVEITLPSASFTTVVIAPVAASTVFVVVCVTSPFAPVETVVVVVLPLASVDVVEDVTVVVEVVVVVHLSLLFGPWWSHTSVLPQIGADLSLPQ